MKIKTSEQIWQKVVDETRLWKDHQQTMKEYLEEVETRWVSVYEIIKWIDNLRKSNDMWRYPVDECFGMLEDAITSDSEPDGSTHNKDYDFGSKKEPQPQGEICPQCMGKKIVWEDEDGEQKYNECQMCDGSGKLSHNH